MNLASELPYYPRFIFNCNDGNCFSTGDLKEFKSLKEINNDFRITHFRINQKVEIEITNNLGILERKRYIITKIEINQIKYDLEEETYGYNLEDCPNTFGEQKKWLMEIYIFLDKIK